MWYRRCGCYKQPRLCSKAMWDQELNSANRRLCVWLLTCSCVCVCVRSTHFKPHILRRAGPSHTHTHTHRHIQSLQHCSSWALAALTIHLSDFSLLRLLPVTALCPKKDPLSVSNTTACGITRMRTCREGTDKMWFGLCPFYEDFAIDSFHSRHFDLW